jgi:hypothetical protein
VPHRGVPSLHIATARIHARSAVHVFCVECPGVLASSASFEQRLAIRASGELRLAAVVAVTVAVKGLDGSKSGVACSAVRDKESAPFVVTTSAGEHHAVPNIIASSSAPYSR